MIKHIKNKYQNSIAIALLFIAAVLLSAFNQTENPPNASPASTHSEASALLLDISGPIGPATQDFIERGIQDAINHHNRLIILRLDTPGGLDSAMRGINKAILSSKVPVITYVAPSGARAASAGTFILYASHIAAMAPGTNIGAASPVGIGQDSSSTLDKKARQDASAYIRSLAAIHNRNQTWAERSVTEAASLSAEEARQLKVIDLIAADIPSLLKAINGKELQLLGQTEKLDTHDLEIKNRPTDWRYKALTIITDPSLAYILLLIGIYGLFFEFSNPGFVLPGVVGSIAIIMALYAFQMLPINYAGFALLLLGLGFMIAEVFISSFGILGIGGVIAFVLGSIFLFDSESPHYQIAWEIIAFMSITTALFFLVLINLAIRSQRKKVTTGDATLIGAEGTVLAIGNTDTDADVTQDEILIRVLGEIWKAKLREAGEVTGLKVGDTVRVEKIENLLLVVQPKKTKI